MTPKVLKLPNSKSLDKPKDKEAEIVKLLSSIPTCLSKKILEKSKFFRKGNKSIKSDYSNSKKLYAQTTGSNIIDILKLKENYPSLSAKKIEDIHRIINNMNKVKPWLNMMTKGLSRKQVIVLMNKNNINNIIEFANKHIANINRALKNVKSKVMVNFICLDSSEITIVSNSVTLYSDLQVIEGYVKNIENIMSNNIQVSRLPQLKSYLKILGIPYFVEGTNTLIIPDSIKFIIKSNYLFNNLSLILNPRAVKASPKSDIVVIWIDVWNNQSSKNNKMLINRCFNIGQQIIII